MSKQDYFTAAVLAGAVDSVIWPSTGLNAKTQFLYGGIRAVILGLLLWILFRCGNNSVILRRPVAALLLISVSAELAGLKEFYSSVVPDQIFGGWLMLLVCGAAILILPGRERALKTGMMALTGIALMCLVLLTVASAHTFRTVHLSYELADAKAYLKFGFFLLPELLLLCLIAPQDQPCREWFRMTGTLWGVGAALALLCELSVGSVKAGQWPLHRMSMLGQISVFRRMEWLVVVPVILLICYKIALYCTGIRMCCPRWDGAGLVVMIFATAGVALLVPAETLWLIEQAACWIVVGFFIGRGITKWIGERLRRLGSA